MKSHCSREKYIENYRECDLELRAIHSLKGKCKRVKFESLCGLELTGHTIADAYFVKWKALSSFVHFFLDSNLHKFSADTYLFSVNVRRQIL